MANYYWATMWKNVHETPVSATVKVTWYRTTHDIIPTRKRLHKIRLTPTDPCDHCNRLDSLQHRLTECGGGPLMWEGTRKLMALMLRIDWKRLPCEWLLRPTLTLWPLQKHRAVLWVLATYVTCRLQRHRELTLNDFHDFLRRARWKLENRNNRAKLVGNYLSVIPEDV